MDVIQLEVSLLDIEPPIERVIQMRADSTMWELHMAIQGAFGWSGKHFFEFLCQREEGGEVERVGLPGSEDKTPVRKAWECPVLEILPEIGEDSFYVYDFGDGWRHWIERVEPENVHPRRKNYPICVGGTRANPIEDIGGPEGFMDFLTTWLDYRAGRIGLESATLCYSKFLLHRYDLVKWSTLDPRFRNPETELKQVLRHLDFE